MYCDSCGKEIKETVVYCRYCGAKVNESKIDKLENYGIEVDGTFLSFSDLGGSDEDRANHYFKLGLEKSNEEELQEAIEYFKKALFYNPKITNCYGNIAVLYQRQKEYDEAVS